MRLNEFDYALPKELIAQQPLEQRDGSRLMVLNRGRGTIEHARFRDIARWLRPGDLLVANDTRVIPARLFGKKDTGGWVELFLLEQLEAGRWECLIRSKRSIGPGMEIRFGRDLGARVIERTAEGWAVELSCTGDLMETLQRIGITPLPPYIRRPRGQDSSADRREYQTVFAASDGAVAAPTAGLHFTPGLLAELQAAGIATVFVTLHVGYGTFQPVRAEEIERHRMHAERFMVSTETADAVNRARSQGRRIIAVGTTSTRVLETMTDEAGALRSGKGETDIYIYPGYRFRSVDGLITNFHVPRSSLLLLVSALAGRECILRAYAEAVRERYRFFSFGDAMLIL